MRKTRLTGIGSWPEDFLFGPPPPTDFKGNGCGPQTPFGLIAILVPEFDISECCRWHDWHYHLTAAGDMPRWIPDFLFAANIWLTRRSHGHHWLRCSALSSLYFVFVRIFGFGTTIRQWWGMLCSRGRRS